MTIVPGLIGSLVEFLQGKLSKSVMERVCRKIDGLFPSPKEIKLSCSCPDGARMCKHVAAALYGVGARLDEKPDLLFTLRAVDEKELIAQAGKNLSVADAAQSTARVIANDDISALFGIDVDDGGDTAGTRHRLYLPRLCPGEARVKSCLKRRNQSLRSVQPLSVLPLLKQCAKHHPKQPRPNPDEKRAVDLPDLLCQKKGRKAKGKQIDNILSFAMELCYNYSLCYL